MLVSKHDPILRSPTVPYRFDNHYKALGFDQKQPPPDVLFYMLKKQLIESKGIGLAAPQIGIPYSVFVLGHHSAPDDIFPVFNPVIIDMAPKKEWTIEEEGCLSFPGMFVKVKRPNWVKVRYSDYTGDTDTFTFTGMTARCFMHEYDHLQGKTFLQTASMFHVEQAKRQAKRLNRR